MPEHLSDEPGGEGLETEALAADQGELEAGPEGDLGDAGIDRVGADRR